MSESKQTANDVEVLESSSLPEEVKKENSDKKTENIHPDLLDPHKSMWKPLIRFFTPLMFSNLLQSLGGLISAAIIGHGLGDVALAAASTILPVNFFLISLVIGLGSGSLVLIGQAFGAGKLEEIRKTVDTTIKFAFLLGIVMAFIGVFFLPDILVLIGAPTAVRPDAMQFGQFIFGSLPLVFIYVAYTTILRGTGDSKTPLLFLLISTGLTILLTPIFTFGWLGLPELRLRGAALASIVATLLSFILLIWYLKRKQHVLSLDSGFFQRFKLDLGILKLLIKIGLPASVQMIAVSLSEVAVVFLVNQHGAGATAAYGAVIQIVNIVQMPLMSIGMAVGVFSAQLIGAKASNRLSTLIRNAVGLNYALGIVITGIIYLFCVPVLRLFLHDTATITMARDVLFAILWALLILGNAMIISSIMRGSGTVMLPMVITIACIWLILVPVASVLSKPYGLLGIWVSYPICDTSMLIILYVFYQLVWKQKQHQSLFGQ